MTDLLQEFYIEYADWLDDGAPDHKDFARSNGLCYALARWAEGHPKRRLYTLCLTRELKRQFIDAGLSPRHPFNVSYIDYDYESYAEQKAHLNPERVAWVKRHATSNK